MIGHPRSLLESGSIPLTVTLMSYNCYKVCDSSVRIIYDIETYPNVFTLAAEHADYPMQWFFQISPWQNDCEALVKFLHWVRDHNGQWSGSII